MPPKNKPGTYPKLGTESDSMRSIACTRGQSEEIGKGIEPDKRNMEEGGTMKEDEQDGKKNIKAGQKCRETRNMREIL